MATDERRDSDRGAPGVGFVEAASEEALSLLGDVGGKRVLELGSVGRPYAVRFARDGAVAIGLYPSARQVTAARRLCEREGVRVELHEGALAELAFLRADSIDAVFSASALATAADLRRVFRQVHRVLKRHAPLVFALPHPAAQLVAGGGGDRLVVTRSYFDRAPLAAEDEGQPTVVHQHTFADVANGLARAGYRLDTVAEPEPTTTPVSPSDFVPRALVVRARKETV